MLAQGSPDDGLECFELIKDGAVNTGPLASTPFFARQQPSAVQRCLQRHALVHMDGTTPDRCVEGPRLYSSNAEVGVTGRLRNAASGTFAPAAELIVDPSTPPAPPCSDILADWRQLRAECGIDWLLAAPLACTPGGHHGSRLLGAVLVAGRGGAPSVDERWLEDWAGEMASNIYHASVQLMEVGGQAGGQGQVASRIACCLRPLHHALAGQNPACFPSCLPSHLQLPLPCAVLAGDAGSAVPTPSAGAAGVQCRQEDGPGVRGCVAGCARTQLKRRGPCARGHDAPV